MYYDVTPQQPKNGYTVAELFAGGGLMAVGLQAAGFDIIWANDFDPARKADKEHPQVRAYRLNIGPHIVQKDVTKLTLDEIPDADIIAGGPPCQDFSVAGRNAGEDGDKGKLVWTYLDIIKGKQPKAFIFENVKGLIRKHRKTFDALLEQFSEIGYTVSWRLINAWDYGIAQKRERVFIIGVRNDLGFAFEFPQPMKGDYRTQVLYDVIGDLPAPWLVNHDTEKAVISEKALAGYDRRYGDGSIGGAFSVRANRWDEPSPTIFGRIANEGKAFIHPNHNPEELSEKALSYLQRDPRHLKKHRPSRMDEPSSTLPAVLEKGVPYGLFYPNHDAKSYWTPPTGRDSHFEQANRVMSMNEPSNTIPAHHNNGQPQHPTQAPRRFTVRECLRIQSVPDWYVLPDDMGLGAQYRIVGNGVASRMSWYLGVALADQLEWAEMLA